MKLLMTLCGAALLMCGATYAQTFGDRITVRFATPVIVGDTTMPAGDCEIQVMHSNSDAIVLVVRSQAGPYTSVLANHLFETGDKSGRASVVLDRNGNTYRLDRVLLPDNTGYQLQSAD